MRKQATIALLLAAGIGIYAACHPHALPAAAQNGTTQSGDIQVLFSPRGGCTPAIVQAINGATRLIRLQAYSFTSKPIAEALVAAIRRGVKVQALLDKSNRTDRYSSATFLRNSGAEVCIDAKHAIAHNKIILIDDVTIVTGSFNFTKAAEESNAENVLIIRNRADVAQAYLRNWESHWRHSERFVNPVKSNGNGNKSRTPAKRNGGAK